MKRLLLILLLAISLPALSQKKNKGYASLTSQFGFYKNSGFLYGGSLNVGRNIRKEFSIGAGFDILKFNGVSSAYAPIYGDLRFYFPSSKSSQVFFTVQPGYGLYNYGKSQTTQTRTSVTTTNVEGQGGFYFSSGFGFYGNTKSKASPVFSIRYCSYVFNYMLNGNYLENSSANGRVNAISINAGIKF
jgi:hypothetical protein